MGTVPLTEHLNINREINRQSTEGDVEYSRMNDLRKGWYHRSSHGLYRIHDSLLLN